MARADPGTAGRGGRGSSTRPRQLPLSRGTRPGAGPGVHALPALRQGLLAVTLWGSQTVTPAPPTVPGGHPTPARPGARLTLVAVAVPAAGDDHGVRHDVLADEAQQLVWDGVVLLGGRGRLLRQEGRLFLLPDGVRFAVEEGFAFVRLSGRDGLPDGRVSDRTTRGTHGHTMPR